MNLCRSIVTARLPTRTGAGKSSGGKSRFELDGQAHLLLNEDIGSWFFLGEIYTNAPLAHQPDSADACGKYSACITVCPTQAIVGPKKLDARRCISYLTIEHKGSIDPELRNKMGNQFTAATTASCFCPWNRDAPTTSEPDFAPRHNLQNRELVDLFLLSADDYDTLTLGSAMRRVSYAQWQRNLAIAVGNGQPTPMWARSNNSAGKSTTWSTSTSFGPGETGSAAK